MDNILTLAGKFKTHVELQEYCDAQFIALERSQKRIATLEAEVAHLKELLGSTTQFFDEPKVEKIVVSPEQAICEIQIKKLQQQALIRELTLEETKRLDLLVKNLYLAKGQATAVIADARALPDNMSEAELVQLAQVDHLPSEPEDGG